MKNFEKQDGISFLLIYFSRRNELYYMRCAEMERFWERGRNGGRKSIRIEELTEKFFLKMSGGYVPYLDALQKDLEERE